MEMLTAEVPGHGGIKSILLEDKIDLERGPDCNFSQPKWGKGVTTPQEKESFPNENSDVGSQTFTTPGKRERQKQKKGPTAPFP
jgi:hypothetical protein